MSRRDHFRLTTSGFTLVRFVAMGAPVALAMPFLEGVREETSAFVTLPASALDLLMSMVAPRGWVEAHGRPDARAASDHLASLAAWLPGKPGRPPGHQGMVSLGLLPRPRSGSAARGGRSGGAPVR